MMILKVYACLLLQYVVLSRKLSINEIQKEEEKIFVEYVVKISNMIFNPTKTLIVSLSLKSIEIEYHKEIPSVVNYKKVEIDHKFRKCTINQTQVAVTSYNLQVDRNITIVQKHVKQNIIEYIYEYNMGYFMTVQNLILRGLHKEHIWPLIVSPHIKKNYENSGDYFTSYIFLVSGSSFDEIMDDINQQIQTLYDFKTFHINAVVFIVFISNITDEKIAHYTIQQFRYVRVHQVVVLAKSTRGFFLGYPQYSSISCTYHIRTVYLKNISSLKHYFPHNLFQIDNSGLKGCELLVYLSPHENYGDSNNLKEYGTTVNYFKGFLIQFLLILADHLNSTMKLGDWLMSDLAISDMKDLMQSQITTERIFVYSMAYSWYVNPAEPFPRWSSLSRVFSYTTWISTILSFILGTFFLRWIATKDLKLYKYRDISRCVVDLWSLILLLGVNEWSNKFSYRIFICCWIIYCMVINTIFVSYVTTYFFNPGYQYQISTFQEIYDLEYELVFDNMGNLITYTENHRGILYGTPNIIDALLLYLQQSKRAAFICEDMFLYILDSDCNEELLNLIYKVKDEEFQMHQMIDMLNPLLISKVKPLIFQLVEGGFIFKIKNDLFYGKKPPSDYWRLENLRQEYESLSVFHLQSPFIFYAIGMLISIVVLISEVTYNVLFKKS